MDLSGEEVKDLLDDYPMSYLEDFKLIEDLESIFIQGTGAIEPDELEEREPDDVVQAIEGDYVPYSVNVTYERWHHYAESLATGFDKPENNGGYTLYEYETDPLPPVPSNKPIQKTDDTQISSVKYAANHYALVQYMTIFPSKTTFKVLIYDCGYATGLNVVHSILCRGGKKIKVDLYDPKTYHSLVEGAKKFKNNLVTVKVLEKHPTNAYKYDIIFVPNGFNNLKPQVREHLKNKLAPDGMLTGVYMNPSSLKKNIGSISGITNISYTEESSINNFFGVEYEDSYFEQDDRQVFRDDCLVFDASVRSIFTESGTMTFLPRNHRDQVLKPVAKVFHLFFAIKKEMRFPCRDVLMEDLIGSQLGPKMEKLFQNSFDMPVTMKTSDMYDYFIPGDTIAACKVDGSPALEITDRSGTYYHADGKTYSGVSKAPLLGLLTQVIAQYELVGGTLHFRQINKVELGGLPFQMPFETLQDMSANSQFFPLKDLFYEMLPEDYPTDGIILAQRSTLGIQYKHGDGKKKDIFSPRRKLNFRPTVDLKGIRETIEKVVSDGTVVRERPGKKPNDRTRLESLAGMCNPAELCFLAMAKPAQVNYHEFENSRKEAREEYYLEYKKPIDTFLTGIEDDPPPPLAKINILKRILDTEQAKVEDFKKFHDGDTDDPDWWDKFVDHQQGDAKVHSKIQIVEEAVLNTRAVQDLKTREANSQLYGSKAIPPPPPKIEVVPWHHKNIKAIEKGDHFHTCEECCTPFNHKHPVRGWNYWSTKRVLCHPCKAGSVITCEKRECPPEYLEGKTVV